MTQSSLVLETDVNSRLDYEHFEAVRAFNQIELPLNPKYYFRTCPSAYCQSKTSYGLSQTEREQYLSQFEAANQALSEDFFDNQPVFQMKSRINLVWINQKSCY